MAKKEGRQKRTKKEVILVNKWCGNKKSGKKRTKSRLKEMQSDEYMKKQHKQ